VQSQTDARRGRPRIGRGLAVLGGVARGTFGWRYSAAPPAKGTSGEFGITNPGAVWAVVMDMGLGSPGDAATVTALADGNASLYTTGAFHAFMQLPSRPARPQKNSSRRRLPPMPSLIPNPVRFGSIC
jgi:hypothetical protein